MLRGLYIAASGMLNEERRLDVIANNIANADTTGFKRAVPVAEAAFSLVLRRVGDGPAAPVIGELGVGGPLTAAVPAMVQGGLRATGRALDLALVGEGFFVVQTSAGVRYTRDGSFSLDREGYLVTADGHRVLGTAGPIRVGSGQVAVTADGEVLVDGRAAGRLRLAAFPAEIRLAREGDNRFRAPEGSVERQAQATVRSGYLELSNVQPVREMVDMIAVMRAYEASQRAVRAHDETLGQAVNEIARF